jgi:integrase
MARKFYHLNARDVETITKPGRHSDGQNLYLSISKDGGSRRWVFLYRWNGKPTELGFGSARLTMPTARERLIEAKEQLANAREKAAQARRVLAAGLNPKESAQKERPAAGATFGECADRFLDAKKAEWRNPKHRAQWAMTLEQYARPLRPLPVMSITVDHVLEVLKPIWQSKPETASRLRGRIERVLDAAKAQALRVGENPARWRGHLDHLLSKRPILSRGHHAAMAFKHLPAFMNDLREREAGASRALEFAILCASRTGEVLGMKWPEVDIESAVWTVPAARIGSLWRFAGPGLLCLQRRSPLGSSRRRGHGGVRSARRRCRDRGWADDTEYRRPAPQRRI